MFILKCPHLHLESSCGNMFVKHTHAHTNKNIVTIIYLTTSNYIVLQICR